MNAVVASGVSAQAYARGFDPAWIDLSKGLGCPVGAVLAGSSEFIHEAWRWKQRIGGTMRQAGVYALDNHVERLAEDHANARRFAEAIAGSPACRWISGGCRATSSSSTSKAPGFSRPRSRTGSASAGSRSARWAATACAPSPISTSTAVG